MKTSLLILLNKIITLCGKILGKNASVYPGRIILKKDNNILTKIKYPKYVIGVTGSSGKGSTTSMIAHILTDNNYKVVWNNSGSNVLNGTATLILNNTSFFSHKLKADILLLELDESYIKETFKQSTLTHLVVTNITRDQPARNGTPEIILNKIKTSYDNKTHLILCADDPLVNSLSLDYNGKVTFYGISQNKYCLDKPISNNLDGSYCPVCKTKLNYEYYHYGHLGNYHCPKCDYQRKVDYEANDIDLDNSSMKIDNSFVHLNKNVFFAAYYTLAAYTICHLIGLSKEQILSSLNINTIASKRLKTLMFGNREVEMLESKNENNLSYLQSLNYINNYNEIKTIILGFENVSRRYGHNDLSWLYDVDFEVLITEKVDRIFCIGRFRFDVATRLINAGINDDKLILVEDINNLAIMLNENSRGKIFTMVCFDMTEILKKLIIKGEKNEN